SLAAALAIRGREIDHELARGGESAPDHPAPVGRLLRDGRLLVFAAAVVLFHLANAAMLPLVGERLSARPPRASPLFMSACIVIAQPVMVPVAILAGRIAATRGRRPALLAGFAALPLRGLLFAVASQPAVLLAIQILDAVGAATLGVVGVLVVADL